MPKNSLNVSLKGADDIFSTEESRQEQQREQVQQIPIGELFPFKNHPFKVLDDESMQRTVESVEQYGVLSPLIARPRPEGGYEIISGHRRQHAAQLAGLDALPVIVRQMDDDAAVLLMVDSNLQRENILPSERAFAYKMKLEALKNQGARSDLTCGQFGHKLNGAKARDIVADESGDNARNVQRFIRLTNLIPELLEMVDEKKIAFNPAVELSYLDESQQRDFLEAIDSLKEWLAEVFAAKKQLQAAPHSPDIATLLTRYLSIEREKSRKYSQGWQQQHTAGELQKISKAIVYLQSKGIATLEDLDAALSSVDEEAKRLNTSVVAKQKRMRTLEKFIEHGSNYNRLKPIHDELKTLKNGWGKKREKFEQAHESDLIIWNAANRFLHANLPEGTKSFKVSEWQKEFDELKAQSTGEYEELKTKRSEVKELQQIRKCIDIVEQAEQRTQEQTHQTPRRKKEDISL